MGMIDSRTYVLVTLERIGGVVMYDVTDPSNVIFKDYVNARNFTPENVSQVGDLAPEGLNHIMLYHFMPIILHLNCHYRDQFHSCEILTNPWRTCCICGKLIFWNNHNLSNSFINFRFNEKCSIF